MTYSKRQPKVLVSCDQCGAEFMAHYCARRRFCGHACAKKARDSRIRQSCEQCGKTFKAKRNRRFCSPKCSTESQKRPAPVVVCKCCGKVFSDHKRLKPKYCSPKCYHKSCRKTVKKRADGRPYEHEKWVLAVVRRDRKCVRCGAVENLQAHHIQSWKSNPDLRYDADNGTTLCALCHHAQHPNLPLERFVASGGKSIRHCVVCEGVFIVKKKSQRTCGWKCGGKLRSQQKAASRRRTA